MINIIKSENILLEMTPRAKHKEPQGDKSGSMLNWLRAAVLGANDGIVSVASIVAGVAGASSSAVFILTAGIAGLAAGALSMAVGEYISVSTQRDTEKAMLEQERGELRDYPKEELEELTGIYEKKGLKRETAKMVAEELTAKNVFAAHVDVELGIDPNNLTNPWQAAFASGTSFVSGAIIPLLAVVFSPAPLRLPIMFIAVLIALAITGSLSARAGGANKTVATIRVIIGGVIAMIITFGIGKLVGTIGL
jgi:VIT1/CCC1 family predicted Fe2+/Mn2+ transporter